MRNLFTIAILFFPLVSLAQAGLGGGNGNNNPNNNNNPDGYQSPPVTEAEVAGSIHLPTFMCFGFNVNDIHVEVTEWSDMINGKIYPGLLTVTVKSNVNWLVQVRSSSEFFMPALGDQGSTHLPCNLIGLKSETTGDFVPLTVSGHTLLSNTTDDIVSSHPIDVKMNYNWNSRGGDYSLGMNFTLSAQ